MSNLDKIEVDGVILTPEKIKALSSALDNVAKAINNAGSAIISAREWFEAYGGIKNKATREMVMNLDSTLPAGLIFKIGKRGRITIQQAPFAGYWRRTIRHSKDLKRKMSNELQAS